jgi:dihydrodipicolinate reductase
MIEVAIHGANGKLGSRIASLIEKSNNITFVGAVNNEVIPKCDVVVDVTSDVGVASLIPRLSGEKLIVGSTGSLPFDELKKYAEKSTVYSP